MIYLPSKKDKFKHNLSKAKISLFVTIPIFLLLLTAIFGLRRTTSGIGDLFANLVEWIIIFLLSIIGLILPYALIGFFIGDSDWSFRGIWEKLLNFYEKKFK